MDRLTEKEHIRNACCIAHLKAAVNRVISSLDGDLISSWTSRSCPPTPHLPKKKEKPTKKASNFVMTKAILAALDNDD